MYRYLSYNILSVVPRSICNNFGVWNNYAFCKVISSKFKFNINYSENLDPVRDQKASIDRFICNLDLEFGGLKYTEDIFFFDNKFNPKESYLDHVLLCDSAPIKINDVPTKLFTTLNTYSVVEDCDNYLSQIKKFKNIGFDQRKIIISKYQNYCQDLKKSVITRDIGISCEKLVLHKEFRINKKYEMITPICKSWSQITNKDLLLDRQFNLFLDFVLVG